MLRELRCGMVLGRWSKGLRSIRLGNMLVFCRSYREDDRNSSTNGLGAVQDCVFAEPQVFIVIALPGCDSSSIQIHFYGLAARESGRHFRVVGVNCGLGAATGWRDG